MLFRVARAALGCTAAILNTSIFLGAKMRPLSQHHTEVLDAQRSPRSQMRRSILAGLSSSEIQALENRAIVAPSITRWSADQLTCIMLMGTTLPLSS